MKKLYFLVVLLLSITAFAQPITVNTNTYTVPQLVQDVLINSQCAQVSNITWRTGNTNGQNSENGIGFFQNTNAGFPIQSGVILSTGRAMSAPGPNTGNLSEGVNSWTGDADLKAQMVAAGVVNNAFVYRNATYLQFDFVPLTDSFSFEFLFASEEYGTYQCNGDYADAFAFILTNTVTGQVTNLAVVPGTSTPISSLTIKNQLYNAICVSQNQGFFGAYYPENGFPPAPINYMGRTIPMTASSTVVPNTLYKIKMVIADGTDTGFDSAVFLKAGSFNVGQATLGGDLTIDNLAALCPGEIRTLDTGLNPAFYTFQWTLNGQNIPGATGASYGVSAPGVYGVIINNNGGSCIQQPTPITVEAFPPIAAGNPVDLTKCGDGTTPVPFNLNDNYANILAGLDPSTIITYHTSLADAEIGANYIPNPANYPTAVTIPIFVNISTGENSCYVIRQFNLNVISCTADPVTPGDMRACDVNSDNTEIFDLTEQNTTILGGQLAADYTITYHTSQANADADINPITPANAFPSSGQTIYVRMEKVSDPIVYGTTSFQLILVALPTATISGPNGICSGQATIVFSGPAGATVHYTADGNPADVTLDATGNATVTTPPVTADTTYTLVSVDSNGTPNCHNTLTGSVTIVYYGLPTATISGATTICSGDTAVLTFNGTPNAVVTYTNGTTNATVTLDGTGAGSATVGPLTATTTYDLVSVAVAGPPACSQPQTGSATITVKTLPTATISGPALVCSGSTGVVTINGTPNAIVTYTDGTTTYTIALDAAGTATFTTAPLTNPTTYTLTSVVTTDVPACTKALTASITIGIQPLPVATVTGPASVCSGSTAEIVFNGTPNATVTYTTDGGTTTQTVTLNSSGTATVTSPALTGPITYQLINVASNGTPACSQPQTDSHTVTTVVAPTINNPGVLEVCDANNDGFETFNLSTVIPQITGGDPNLTVTFHETPQDAQLGNYPITMPLYTNINPNTQILYIRVVNTGVNACASFTTLTLVVNPRPIIAPVVTDYVLCETSTPGDGFEVFNLNTKDTEVINGQPGVTVTYYTNQADALAGNNAIVTPGTYTNATNPETIWYQLKNIHGCIAVGSFKLMVNPLPVVPMPVPAYSLCDYTGLPLHEEFDLSTKIPEIIGTTTGLNVTFYFSQADAQAGVAGTELPLLYTNQVPTVQTIFVRVENTTTHCFSVTAMDLRVEPLPVLVMPTAAVMVCDTNSNGFSSFDLTALIPNMLNGEPNVAVSFYETQTNAENGLDPITTNPYDNINPFTQTLWVLATNTVTGCKSVYSFNLQVNSAPEIPTLIDLTKCDEDNNPHDNQTYFDLTVQTPILLTAQTGPATDYEVRYFVSQAFAEAGTPFIVSDANFMGTDGQDIWVRINNLVTGCHNITRFKLHVNSPLLLTQPDQITKCDEALPNDQRTEFDLTIRENQITGGATGYTFAYYASTVIPPAAGTLITTPTAYTNTATAQSIVIGVTSNEGCTSYIRMTIRVTPLPEPKFDPQPIVTCDDAYPNDGITTVDVTVNATYIQNGDPTYVLTYHASQADAEAGVNPIATPTNWSNQDANGNALQSVWIRVTTAPASAADRCSLVVEQPIVVNPLPAVGPMTTYYLCQPGTSGSGIFDLTTKDPQALAGQNPADFTVTYHESHADAQNNTAIITTPSNYPYTNVIPAKVIGVRIVNNATGCVNTAFFELLVEEEATATAPDPADTTVCDEDGTNDGFHTFDLTDLLDAQIMNGQTNPDYVIHYYANAQDLINNNPIPASTNPADNGHVIFTNTIAYQQTIIAQVTHTTTVSGCPANVDVILVVNPLPEPTPNGGFVCIDQETGTVLSTHIINSGLDAATYSFEWFDGTTLIAGETGPTLEVNHPATYSVVATNIATGCQNLPVSVTVTQSEPAAVTAYVSNAFTDNQTITVEAIGIGEYVYQLDEGDIQTSPVFENVTHGSHTVTVYDNKGCASVTIPVTAINYPHYFTPNGDNYHDTWNIGDLENDASAKIYIFDRYGKLLKQIKPSKVTGWDGTLNGQPLPSTDYWFTVTYTEQGQLKEFKAHFSLKR
ncbi:choice-of-anchor L domain-containing protein [Flavobacterium inviolabile]|uniref:choice-of-anchor L domain-containing protein n=1 Tax=Flavobacterium inviolabile TaxID=2748320 RepID=UPI0015B06564|nr:choice-of-anchor L domain-containing protein [Flavobacterium inviolabile]